MRPIKSFILLAGVLATSACANLETGVLDEAVRADYLARCELITGIERLACFDLFSARPPGARPDRG